MLATVPVSFAHALALVDTATKASHQHRLFTDTQILQKMKTYMSKKHEVYNADLKRVHSHVYGMIHTYASTYIPIHESERVAVESKTRQAYKQHQ